MLKKLYLSLLLGSSLMGSSVHAQSTVNTTIPTAPPIPSSTPNTTIPTAPPIPSSTTSGIEQQLNAALQKAENEVQTQLTNATRRDVVPRWDDKVQLQNAIIQLDVKKTLVANFRGTPTLQNPIIQAKLLELLNKDMITEGDLAELQSLTNQVKAQQKAAH